MQKLKIPSAGKPLCSSILIPETSKLTQSCDRHKCGAPP